ncbi:MAG: prephenate dehydratase [Gammaproteobacteria bacterium]
METGLPEVRAQIDAADDEMLALLRRRARLTAEAGKIKRAAGAKVFARPEREADILRRLAPGGGALSESSVRTIFREIISACLALEKPQTVCYLGPPHTFTHEAARKHFGGGAQYESAETVRAVFARAEKGLCDFAVAPFENSGEGTVGDTFEMLMETPLAVCGETTLRVRHNLLAAESPAPSEIKTIYAHPQAFAQCRRWLGENAPRAALFPAESNAAAARHVAENKPSGAAAIASQSAGTHYRLQTVAADIEDSADNRTRFLTLGTESPAPSAADKTSFIMHMAASDRAGTLYQLLEPLSRLGVNMTKFESRPARGKFGEYFFYVDIDGHREDAAAAQALDEIRGRAAFLKVLGSYPRAAE